MSAALHLVEPEPYSPSEIVAGQVRAEMARQCRKVPALVDLLGRSRATVYRRYNGKSTWRIDELQMIADWLDIDLADLVKHPFP